MNQNKLAAQKFINILGFLYLLIIVTSEAIILQRQINTVRTQCSVSDSDSEDDCDNIFLSKPGKIVDI